MRRALGIVVGVLAALWLLSLVVDRGQGGTMLDVGRLTGKDVLDARRTAPDTVSLSVASCNQNPKVSELTQSEPGVYQVLVKTEIAGNGEACADELTINVDPDHQTITIIDRASGNTFELLGTGQPLPLGMNGTWRLVTFDMGRPVLVGENTPQVPEVIFTAEAKTGTLEGMFGCNDLQIDVVFVGETVVGDPESLDGTKKRCPSPPRPGDEAPAEEVLLKLLVGDEPAQVYLDGDHLELSTLETNAVFERMA